MTDAYIANDQPFPEPEPQPVSEPAPTNLPKANWIDLFTGVLIAPVRTFDYLAELNANSLTGLGAATIAVIVPFALEGLRLTPANNLAMAWLQVPLSICLGLFLWLVGASFYALLAAIFGSSKAGCRSAFVLTAWAFAPWIFMGPLTCYKQLLGPAFPLVAFIPLAWAFALQILAVKRSFQLSSAHTVALFFVIPFLYQTQSLLEFVQGIYSSASSLF